MKSRQKSDKRKQRFSEDWQQAVLKLQDSTTNSTALSQEITKSEPAGQTPIDLLPPNPMGNKLRKPERYKFENGEWWYYYPESGTSIESGNHIKERASTLRRKLDKISEEKKKHMYVNGKRIPDSHPLYKAGKYKGFEEAAFSSLENFKDNPQGEVYVITNPAWPEWVKVGMAVDSEDRIKNYQTSSPFRDYNLVYSYEVDDRRAAESAAHVRLAKECDNINEWFRLPPPIANELILEVIHEY